MRRGNRADASSNPKGTPSVAPGLVAEEVRRQEALADLASRALRGGPYPAFAQGVVERIAGVMNVEVCEVFELVAPDRLLLRAGIGRDKRLVGAAAVGAGPGSPAGFALASQNPVVLGDLRQEVPFREARLWRDAGVVSGVTVGIFARGALGALGVHYTSRREFGEEELCFLRSAADVLGMAVERGLAETESRRTFEEQDRKVRAAEGRFAFLSEATTVLTAAPDPTCALAATARLAVPALADWCFVDVVREGNGAPVEIRRLAVAGNPESPHGRDPTEGPGLRYYPMNPGAPHGTSRVLRTGRPEMLRAVGREVLETIAYDDGEHRGALRPPDPASYMCVPLQVGRRLIGAIGLVSTSSRRLYGEEDLALAEGLARCVALVVRSAWEGPSSRPKVRGLDLLTRRAEDPPALTPRQREVLDLLEAGLSAKEIGARLVIAETTVRKHIRDLLRAFGAHSQREALFKARGLGLLEREGSPPGVSGSTREERQF